MKNIVLEYRHLMGLFARTVITSHPDKWEELTARQMIAITRLKRNDISEDELLCIMMNLPMRVVKKLDTFQRYKIGEILAFLEQQVPYNKFILKSVAGLNAPDDYLLDVTFAEFIHFDTFFMDYADSRSDSDLKKLVACLYVLPDKNGKRPLFDGTVNTDKIKCFTSVEIEAIAINYGFIREWLSNAYPEVFPKAKQRSDDETQPKRKGNGWVDVFDSLVGDDLINSEKYANMPVTEVLRFMNRKVKENRKKSRNHRG